MTRFLTWDYRARAIRLLLSQVPPVLPEVLPVLIHSLSYGLPRGSEPASALCPSPTLTLNQTVPFLLTYLPWLPISLYPWS